LRYTKYPIHGISYLFKAIYLCQVNLKVKMMKENSNRFELFKEFKTDVFNRHLYYLFCCLCKKVQPLVKK